MTVIAGWPEFDHEVLGYAQVSNFIQVSGPPQTSRIKTLGGPSRSRTKRGRAGAIVTLNWLMTNSQVRLLRAFWDDELVGGQYPFAMQLLLDTDFVWRACKFLRDFSQAPLSATDWAIESEIYIGYHPTWTLRPGAVGMPFQRPIDFLTAPDPVGYLIPRPLVDITVQGGPSFVNEIQAYSISTVSTATNSDLLLTPSIRDI